MEMPAYVVERLEGALKDIGVSQLKEANLLLLKGCPISAM